MPTSDQLSQPDTFPLDDANEDGSRSPWRTISRARNSAKEIVPTCHLLVDALYRYCQPRLPTIVGQWLGEGVEKAVFPYERQRRTRSQDR